MLSVVSRYDRHRFPAEIIIHCVRLYFRFALSFRDVEELLAMRDVGLCYKTVREWCFKFGQTYDNHTCDVKLLGQATSAIFVKSSPRTTDASTNSVQVIRMCDLPVINGFREQGP
jgi:hypothetical protein